MRWDGSTKVGHCRVVFGRQFRNGEQKPAQRVIRMKDDWSIPTANDQAAPAERASHQSRTKRGSIDRPFPDDEQVLFPGCRASSQSPRVCALFHLGSWPVVRFPKQSRDEGAASLRAHVGTLMVQIWARKRNAYATQRNRRERMGNGLLRIQGDAKVSAKSTVVRV